MSEGSDARRRARVVAANDYAKITGSLREKDFEFPANRSNCQRQGTRDINPAIRVVNAKRAQGMCLTAQRLVFVEVSRLHDAGDGQHQERRV